MEKIQVREMWREEDDLIISDGDQIVRLVNVYPTSITYHGLESSDDEAVITLEKTWQS